MAAISPCLLILPLLISVSLQYRLTSNDAMDQSDDDTYFPERFAYIPPQQQQPDINLADLLESKQAIAEVRQLLEEFSRRRVKKHLCSIGAGLSGRCDNNDLHSSFKEEKYLQTADSPGRRRRQV